MTASRSQATHRPLQLFDPGWPNAGAVFRCLNGHRRNWMVCVVAALLTLSNSAIGQSDNSNRLMLPFAGTFQSLASEAQELRSREDNTWITIPQNVYLTLHRDEEIVELQLHIEVLDDEGRVLYPIANRMWLRSVGDNQLEIYKLDSVTNRFAQVGKGSCTTDACSYQYVALSRNHANPYKQRYTSMTNWDPNDLGNGFSQSGSLATEVTDDASGQAYWLEFKTWTNRFNAIPDTQSPAS